MKVNYLIKALPLLVIALAIWQWSYIKSVFVAPSDTASSGSKSADETSNDRMPSPTEIWQVTSVSDGDTIAVVRDGTEAKIRFCGIDAPEISHGSSPGQLLGKESKDNLQKLIDEAQGKVSISIVDTDRYGRKVAEVFTVLGRNQEKFLQEEQVKSGLAYHYAAYSANCPNQSSIIKAEEIAQSTKSGVWGGSYEKPWDYRKAQRNPQAVNTIITEKPGDYREAQRNPQAVNTDITSDSDKDNANHNSSPAPDNQDKAISYANISLANTLEGHSDKVSSLAISPNGKTLVSGSSDRTIKIWDLSTNGTLVNTLTASSSINSVIISPDGQTLITGDNSSIKIWDLGSGTVKSILTESSGANVLAISPDGKTLVSGQGKSIKIWDLNKQTLRNTVIAHSNDINFLSVKSDGQTLISGSKDGTSKEWNLSTTTLQKLTPWNFQNSTVAFSAEQEILATNSYGQNIVKILDVKSNFTVGTFNGNSSNLTSLAISPDKRTIVIGSAVGNNTIEIWRVL